METSRCRWTDWKELDKIFAEAFGHISPSDRAYRLRNYYRGIQVFRVDGRIAGFTLHIHGKSPGMAWLEQIAVSQDFRGKGLGKKILNEYENQVSRAGYSEIGLAVRPDNHPAIALYREAGFQPMKSEGSDLAFKKNITPASQPDSSLKRRLSYFPNLPRRVLLKFLYRLYIKRS